jgi:hypothetical protein
MCPNIAVEDYFMRLHSEIWQDPSLKKNNLY